MNDVIKLAKRWDAAYRKYAIQIGVLPDMLDEYVMLKIRSMNEYWTWMMDNPASKIYKSFADMLHCEIDQTERLLEYYERFGDVVIPDSRRPGFRYLP